MTPIRIMIYGLYIFVLSACAGPDRESRARDVCGCLQPLDSLNALMPEILAMADAEAAMDHLSALAEAAGAARNCLEEAGISEDTSLTGDAALKSLLDRDCPGWEAILAALPLD